MCYSCEVQQTQAPSVESVANNTQGQVSGGGGRRPCGADGCSCGEGWVSPPPHLPTIPPITTISHPLRALDRTPGTLLRSNPLYTEDEEQEVVIIVDSLDPEQRPEIPSTPRRAPSTSSGYGSAGGSHGRSSPTLVPKVFDEPRLSDSEKTGSGSQSASDAGSPICTLSRSMKEDIQSCLGGYGWRKDVNDVVEAAVKGAAGVTIARARLQAALLALQGETPGLPKLPNRGPSLPYCGPGVRPGDVTMMPKTTEMSLLAASALFTLDRCHGEVLAKRLARRQRTRQRCRVTVGVLALLLLVVAVGSVELFMSRGRRLFGTVLQ